MGYNGSNKTKSISINHMYTGNQVLGPSCIQAAADGGKRIPWSTENTVGLPESEGSRLIKIRPMSLN